MPEFTGRLRVTRLSDPPTNPQEGEVYFDTDDKHMHLWNGTTWEQSGVGPQGPPGPAGADGAAGPQGPPGGSASLFAFQFSTSTSEPPTGSQMRMNAADQTAATLLWIRSVTSDGVDASVGLSLIQPGTRLYIQDKDDSTKYQRYDATGWSESKSGYYEVPVSYVDGGNPLTAQAVLLAIVQKGQPGPAGPPGPPGADGAQGPPGPSTGPAGGDLNGTYPNPTVIKARSGLIIENPSGGGGGPAVPRIYSNNFGSPDAEASGDLGSLWLDLSEAKAYINQDGSYSWERLAFMSDVETMGGRLTYSFLSSQTFALAGPVSTGVIPGMTVAKDAQQDSWLERAYHRAGAGTATVQVRVNGTLVNTLNITTTPNSTYLTGLALADGDYIDLNVTAASGASDISISLKMTQQVH